MNKTIDQAKAGAQLRALREARGWSRPQLAAMTDVAEATIRNIEKNYRSDGKETSPYPRTIGRLARAFGREDGIVILEAFGCENLIDSVFGDETPLVSGTGLSPEQEGMIARIVEGLVELAQSGNANSGRNLVDLSRYRVNPRYVKRPPIEAFSRVA